MKQDTETTATAVQKALAYLSSRKALHKLEQPCLIVGRDICIWMPARQSSLAETLPPLERMGDTYRYPVG